MLANVLVRRTARLGTRAWLSMQHYEVNSEAYNASPFHATGSEMEAWRLGLIVDSFKLGSGVQRDWQVADIGGGGGWFSSLLYKRLELRNPVVCVDPSKAMIREAESRAGVVAKMQDGTSFVQSLESGSLDRALLHEVIHHFTGDELPVFFNALTEGLAPGGVCLIVTHPHDGRGRYPFFDAAFDVWSANQPKSEDFAKLMKSAGLDVSTKTHEFEVILPHEQWCRMVRSRFWSTFSHFSDAELEAGVEEIRRNFPEDAEGNIHFNEALVFIRAEKKG